MRHVSTRFSAAILLAMALVVGAQGSAMAQDSEAPSISELATDEAGFTTLRLALAQTGLAEMLGDCSSGDLYTVLAPNDLAFVNAASSGFDVTQLSSDAEAVADVVRYHLIEGAFASDAVLGLDGASVPTVQGEEVTIGVDGDTISIGSGSPVAAVVTATDIQACNGVVHVIDNVLAPPTVAAALGISQDADDPETLVDTGATSDVLAIGGLAAIAAGVMILQSRRRWLT